MTSVDTVIIGGGINGCGCAADAAMRGLSVVLIEQGDLASQTSSSSSKLIHGGLRYLEHYDFALVRKALNERQTLLQVAPHLVHPLQFVLPHQPHLRSPLILRAGLIIYDHLSRQNHMPSSKAINRKQNSEYFMPLNGSIDKGFTYYDCITDDARLTLANALQAKQHGASIITHAKVTRAKVINEHWHITYEREGSAPQVIIAKTLINATGPWVQSLNKSLQIPNQHQLSLVKGSHLVLKKRYPGNYAYVLQHTDKRLVFTIPYYGHTLVGTTEVICENPPKKIHIEPEEIRYLLDTVTQYFKQPANEEDIVTAYSGVRPLLAQSNKNTSAMTRDYVYHFSQQPAPCVSIYGGKITTYRKLAKEVIDQLRPCFPDLKASTTHFTPLPGASLDHIPFQQFAAGATEQYAWLEPEILTHYLRTYGTDTAAMLHNATRMEDLGLAFSSVLYQREVDYLLQQEWAETAEDILWRRTKLGLTITPAEEEQLNQYLTGRKSCLRITSSRATRGISRDSEIPRVALDDVDVWNDETLW